MTMGEFISSLFIITEFRHLTLQEARKQGIKGNGSFLLTDSLTVKGLLTMNCPNLAKNLWPQVMDDSMPLARIGPGFETISPTG